MIIDQASVLLGKGDPACAVARDGKIYYYVRADGSITEYAYDPSLRRAQLGGNVVGYGSAYAVSDRAYVYVRGEVRCE